MNPLPDFLQPLEFFSRPFPLAAVGQTIARREESQPHLLDALEIAARLPNEAGDRTYMLHEYAMYILAQWREPAAARPLVALARNPDLDDILGDTITEGLAPCLASVCGSEPELLRTLIEDAEANEYARNAGVRALGCLVSSGIMSREEFSIYLGELLTTRLEREPCYVWDGVVCACTDFGFSEHLDAIRHAYRAGYADQFVDALEDVEEQLTHPATDRSAHERYDLITSAIAEMEWWYCFTEKAAGEEQRDLADEDFSTPPDFEFQDSEPSEPMLPYLRDTPKIGRNEPCPCGSGRKYKKCCGQTP